MFLMIYFVIFHLLLLFIYKLYPLFLFINVQILSKILFHTIMIFPIFYLFFNLHQ